MQSFISNKKGDEYKIMGLLIMLIGVSGCGKSSFARDSGIFITFFENLCGF